jgi:hypothetical protein
MLAVLVSLKSISDGVDAARNSLSLGIGYLGRSRLPQREHCLSGPLISVPSQVRNLGASVLQRFPQLNPRASVSA